MAKHGKKKIFFSFNDLDFASFFLNFIRQKKFYGRVTGFMKYTGKLGFSITGSPENVKMTILKIKRLYNKARKEYAKNKNLIHLSYAEANRIITDDRASTLDSGAIMVNEAELDHHIKDMELSDNYDDVLEETNDQSNNKHPDLIFDIKKKKFKFKEK
ncbi:MAG: hypothetical protein ACTSU2_02010 [Promethearchaeota archaeon]